jgi:hypothetical protein
MKKWFIFGVIAAMFAMVMFTACPSGDDGGGAASMPVVDPLKNQAGDTLVGAIITWDGVDGYNYYVYFEQRDISGIIKPLVQDLGVKGQTVYGFKKKVSNNVPVAPYWEIDRDNTSATNWAIAIGSDVSGAYTGLLHYVGNPFDSKYETVVVSGVMPSSFEIGSVDENGDPINDVSGNQVMITVNEADYAQGWVYAKDTDGSTDYTYDASGSGGSSAEKVQVPFVLEDYRLPPTTTTNTITVLNLLDTAFGDISAEVSNDFADPKIPRTTWYRVGVAAANPGGYPIEDRRVVVYSDWF